jgi:hypothetical protein
MADNEALRPGRGLVNGILLSTPFYVALALLLVF